jgi:RecA/RadA recombinase
MPMGIDDLIKATGSDYASRVSDGNDADIEYYIDTGSYSLNALISGSIYGGIPGNKVTALAGSEATGKTFYALNIVQGFLDKNPTGYVFYFESEHALTTDQLESRGIDTERFIRVPVVTVEEFRTQCVRILDKYMEIPEKERYPLFMVLDSMGNLSTTKEVSDIAGGIEKRDMTRTQLIRGAFRVLTLKLGRCKVALLVINHTYDVVGAYMPTKEMSGGGGLKYAASTIIFLTKSKKWEENAGVRTIAGAEITAVASKSRLTIENKRVETLLDYVHGLNPYYGLLEIGERGGVLKKISKKWIFPGMKAEGKKEPGAFEKEIYANPEQYFTEEILQAIDAAAQKEFKYGAPMGTDDEVAEVEE